MRLAIAQKHEKILVEQLKDCLSFDQNLRHFLQKAHNFPCEHLIKANDEISHDQYVVTHFRQRFKAVVRNSVIQAGSSCSSEKR